MHRRSSRLEPADAKELAELLERHGIRARHRLGQNFLVDPSLRDRIVEAAELRGSDEVLEVGAGAGTLTVPLAWRCRRLVAVELERRLAHVLRAQISGLPNVTILEADILKVDLAGLFPRGGHVVVGNIPYYLTGALMPRLLEPPARPRRLLLVVQKEVAERWTRPGDWSLSSVAVQVFAQPRLAFELPAAAFQPPPKVDSALVVLEVRPRPALPQERRAAFFDLVEKVFQFRRKQLGGSLARVRGISAGEAGWRLRALGIEPARRPQTLSLAEWEAVDGAFPASPAEGKG